MTDGIAAELAGYASTCQVFGSTTLVTGRTSTNGNTTTVYDARGRKAGSVTTNRGK
jgi:YD repeat-containing protein